MNRKAVVPMSSPITATTWPRAFCGIESKSLVKIALRGSRRESAVWPGPEMLSVGWPFKVVTDILKSFRCGGNYVVHRFAIRECIE